MKIGIIGAGSWGTALAEHLAQHSTGSGREVMLWGRDEEVLLEIEKERVNSRYLPEVTLSEGLRVEKDLRELVRQADVYVLSVPSGATRDICKRIKEFKDPGSPTVIVSTGKGLEISSNKRLSEVIRDELGSSAQIFALSGPSFALEVARGLPTALVLASEKNGPSEEMRRSVVTAIHSGTMRVYTSSDLVGVELGGVLKNVISVASGIGDGLGLGLNARAGILTRGLKELSVLIEAEGGKASAVIGLSGLGDLILTGTGDLSRNRKFGMLLGRGLSIEEAKVEIGQTIEASTTCISASALSKKHGLETPIIHRVARVVTGEITPSQALRELMMREQKAE